MNDCDRNRTVLSLVVAALLAGCGGAQPPIGAPGAMPQSSARSLAAQRSEATAQQRNAGASWMAPEAKSEDLLYASSCCWVSIYSYPQGKEVGRLNGFRLPEGQCVDSSGNVYITDLGSSRVYKYAHGGTRRQRTFFVPGATDCSIDPATGNLAVTSWSTKGVWVFKNAAGRATKYTDSHFLGYYGCGYDSKGNLFVDGNSHVGSGNVVFAELPKGSSKLKTVKLDQNLEWPGGVKWDGKYIAVSDGTTPVVYQFAIKERTGTKVGTTPLGSGELATHQIWIQGQTLLTATQCEHLCHGVNSNVAVMFFDYPTGGMATKMITTGFKGQPVGVSVSLASGKR